MLSLYESFAKCNVPTSLANHILDNEENPIDTIENINKINIFVGANNSGKSKIIREIIKSNFTNYHTKSNWEKIFEEVNTFFSSSIASLSLAFDLEIFKGFSDSRTLIFDFEKFINEKEKITKRRESNDVVILLKELQYVYNGEFKINKNELYFIHNIKDSIQLNGTVHYDILNKIHVSLNEIDKYFDVLMNNIIRYTFVNDTKDFNKIYIPSIRTLRPFGKSANIKGSTKREYEIIDSIQIFNGEDLPNHVYDLNNAPYERRRKIRVFENFLSTQFFEQQKVTLTYSLADHILLIKIGEEKERPIHDLGDGIQMIIILTFPFLTMNSGIIAIDEPELFIHPGLQKRFINFLVDNDLTREFQIYISTHSNHIIDAVNNTDKISLFTVKKKHYDDNNLIEQTPSFIINNVAYGNETILKLLGITNTSVYLSNCTIWVEGITDKIYLQKYISEYLKNLEKGSKYEICNDYQEGINYSFALTAGDSIIHWDFSDDAEYDELNKSIIVRKFCSKSLVIVDSDFSKNSERKDRLKALLNDRFIELELPEIENYLTQNVINEVVVEYLSVKKALGDKALPSLADNIFHELKMGHIVDNHLLKDLATVKKFAASNENKGSIKSTDKLDFCTKAIQHINHQEIKVETKKLVETILDFIIAHN